MKIDERIYERRMLEFPEQIRQLSIDNPIIHRLIDAYVMGSILTREECLFQMVIALSKTESYYREELTEAMKWSSKPIIFPSPTEPPTE